MAESPIVCTLSPEALNARKQQLLARVAAVSKQTVKIESGYRFEFVAARDTLSLIAHMIDAERQCCQFLRFNLIVEPNSGPISLELTGPSGTQQFLDALLEPA